MSFDDYSDQVGRRPSSILELDLDRCSRSYGVSPCAATLGLQNFFLHSDDLSNAVYVKGDVTITVDQDTHPILGGTIVDEVLETATTTVHRFRQVYSSVDATKTYTASMVVKGISRGKFLLRVWNETDTANYFSANFDIDTQTIISSGETGDGSLISARMVSEADGYYRLIVTGVPDTLGGATDGVRVDLYILDDTGASSYLGDITKGAYVCAVQLREGLFPGKYAQTTTTLVDGMGTADDLCFNTFGTCQDTANYLKEIRTMRFCDRAHAPVGLIDAYPAIESVRYGPTKIVPGGGFSVRGRVTVVLQDFEHNDVSEDDYAVERTYDQESQGTFFGRFKARHLFYEGRVMRVKEGYMNEPFAIANYRTREYLISNVAGPDEKGRVTITGIDVLGLAKDKNAKCPIPSSGSIDTAMDDTTTTVSLQTGEGPDYDSTDPTTHIRIGDEIMSVTSRATDDLTVVRGVGGTVAESHDSGDAVQLCKTYEDEPVIDVIDDLLTNFANVPSSYIPTTDWEDEETATLSGYDLETIISEPTGVQKLLKEISEITLIDLWYSDVDQEIKLKLQTPYTAVDQTITDADDIVIGSLRAKDVTAKRLSRVLIYYGMKDFARDLTETENYKLVNFEIEADKEGINKFAEERTKVIFTRWMDSTNSTQIALTSQRLLARFGNTPVEIEFTVDAKDVTRLETGDVFDFTSRILQGVDGLPTTTRFQVTETTPKQISSQYRYKAWAFFEDPAADSITISTNQTDYDLFIELGGPPAAIDVTVTINAAITVDGTIGNPAFSTGAMHPDSTVRIVNNGMIRGHGGGGGRGGSAAVYVIKSLGCIIGGSEGDGFAGSVGGDAIDTNVDLSIDNTGGEIFGGGGGGGGGGGFGDDNLALDVVETAYSGGGGGGGRGTDTAGGGLGGDTSDTEDDHPTCILFTDTGPAGAAGATGAAGAGGVTSEATVGDGGAGGDWGADGTVGEDATDPSPDTNGGGGGAGGYAVRLNGNSIIWEAGNTAAKVKGDVA